MPSTGQNTLEAVEAEKVALTPLVFLHVLPSFGSFLLLFLIYFFFFFGPLHDSILRLDICGWRRRRCIRGKWRWWRFFSWRRWRRRLTPSCRLPLLLNLTYHLLACSLQPLCALIVLTNCFRRLLGRGR